MISKREFDANVDEIKQRIVSDFVGNTPFVKLSEKLYAKLESVNPGGSIKDRPVKWILDTSEQMGLINKNSTITIDRTRKLYIGGAQKRSDSGYDKQIYSSNTLVGQVPLGNRKDIRDAVEAAANEKKWKGMSAHGRAQVLYYAAENLELRKQEFAQTILEMTGENGNYEVEKALETIFYFASWTDKFEGSIHNVPIRGVSLAMKEPLGVIAIICPDNDPLLSFIHLVFSALSG